MVRGRNRGIMIKKLIALLTLTTSCLAGDVLTYSNDLCTASNDIAYYETATLWTPASDTGLLFWVAYDAPETIITNAAGIVQWQDMSGLDNHITQTNAAYEPSLTSEGVRVEIGDYMTGGGLFTGTPDILMLSYSKIVSAPSGYGRFLYMGNPAGNYNKLLALGRLSNQNAILQGLNGRATFNNITTNKYQLLIGQKDASTAISASRFYEDGTEQTMTGAFPYGWDITQLEHGINCAPYLYDSYLKCAVVSHSVDLTTRRKYEGYIAWHYNNLNMLPKGHPYRYRRPRTDD